MKKQLPQALAILLLHGFLMMTLFADDASVMLDLKKNLNPPGWSDPDPCNWNNVACSDNKRVTQIQIGSLNLQGTLPGTLQNLPQLQHLELQNNYLSGPLPDFSGLTSLQVLILSHNQFTGRVPGSLVGLRSLKVVNLTGNYFQGAMPVFGNGVEVDNYTEWNSFCLPSPGDCDPRVETLLSIVGLMGYPQVFGETWTGNDPCANWVGLVCFDGNIAIVNFLKMGLNGTISPEFAKLNTLQRIVLAYNNLTGSIPEELVTLPELTMLNVANNRLYGKVPSFRSNVDVNITGNVDIGKDPPPPSPTVLNLKEENGASSIPYVHADTSESTPSLTLLG